MKFMKFIIILAFILLVVANQAQKVDESYWDILSDKVSEEYEDLTNSLKSAYLKMKSKLSGSSEQLRECKDELEQKLNENKEIIRAYADACNNDLECILTKIKKRFGDKYQNLNIDEKCLRSNVKNILNNFKIKFYEKAEYAKEKIKETAENVKDSAKQSIDDSQDTISNLKDKIYEKAEDFKETASDLKDAVSEKIEDSKDAIKCKSAEYTDKLKGVSEDAQLTAQEYKDILVDYFQNKYDQFKDAKISNRLGRVIENFRKSKYLDKANYSFRDIADDIKNSELTQFLKKKSEDVVDFFSGEEMSPEVADALDKSQVTENNPKEDILFGQVGDL